MKNKTRCTQKHARNLIIFLLLAIIFISMGCAKTDDGAEKSKGLINIAHGNWAEDIAMTNLVRAILEDKMGYEVDLTMAEVGLIFTSIANGDSDFTLDSWLPVTHKTYMEEYGDKLDDYGTNFENAKFGFVVP